MSNFYTHGSYVPPKSKAQIAQLTDAMRQQYGITGFFPVIEYLEYVSMDFEVKSIEQMGDNLGLTKPDGSIWLREDVYDGACDDVGFHRFTVAHEIGHALMHKEHIGFARNFNISDKIFCNSEWQANEFAGSLLIPKEEIQGKILTATAVSKKYGVSLECAMNRLKKI